MSISAIVVVYRTRDLLHRLLDELFHEPRVSQILVLDNSGEEKGSTSSRDSRPLYLTNRKNIGFAAAVNQAAALANSKWVAVINSDVRLIGRCLGELFDAAQAHDAPAVGPRFYCDDAKTFRLPPATGFCRSDYWLGRLARQHAIDARLYQFDLGFVESASSFSVDRIPSGEDSYFEVSKSPYFVFLPRLL